jgi:ubiquinone/menaquinone biosynthesis C-methylase UbiE
MERVPEPELMEGEAQADAYARADFDHPNTLFCDVVTRLSSGLREARAVDLGCGPADIPVRLAQRHPDWRIDAVDGSAAMLAHADRAIDGAGLRARIRLHRARLPGVALPDHGFDLVISNSLLHHLHQPVALWREIARLGRPGATVAVMDLVRPADAETARAIVARHAAGEPDVLREDFYRSLLAAFTQEEVRAQLDAAGLGSLAIDAISDRHMLVAGTLAR